MRLLVIILLCLGRVLAVAQTANAVSANVGIVLQANAPSPSSLNTNVECYWKMEESSGVRMDSEPTGTAQNLTNNNSNVLSAAGIFGKACWFQSALSTRLLHSDSLELSTGDINFTIAAWIYMHSLPTDVGLVAKWGSSTTKEYMLYYDGGATNRFAFVVSPNGTSQTFRYGTSGGPVAVFTWYLIVAWHDATANTLNIQINNGAVDSQSYSSGVFDSTSELQIGRYLSQSYHNGLIDEVLFTKRILTSAERAALYNSGSATSCCPFPP